MLLKIILIINQKKKKNFAKSMTIFSNTFETKCDECGRLFQRTMIAFVSNFFHHNIIRRWFWTTKFIF